MTTRRRAISLGLVLAAVVGAALAGVASAGVSIAPPSGQTPTVAYVTDTASTPATVWTMALGGSQKTRLGPGTDPLVAPNGQQVAVSLYGTSPNETGPALAIYSTTGTAPLTYLQLSGENAEPLAWSRDGRYLAVEVNSTAVTNNAAPLSGLAIVDLQLNTVKVIVHGQVSGASFAPNGSDELVYGLSSSQLLTGPVNLYRSSADGSNRVALTSDGRSLNPVWGPASIAYDKEQLRHNVAPLYQIWLRSLSGSRARRLTNVPVASLVSGLVPLAFSADGSRLVDRVRRAGHE